MCMDGTHSEVIAYTNYLLHKGVSYTMIEDIAQEAHLLSVPGSRGPIRRFLEEEGAELLRSLEEMLSSFVSPNYISEPDADYARYDCRHHDRLTDYYELTQKAFPLYARSFGQLLHKERRSAKVHQQLELLRKRRTSQTKSTNVLRQAS